MVMNTCDNVSYIAAEPTFIPGGELQNLEVVQGENAKFTCLNKGTPTPKSNGPSTAVLLITVSIPTTIC